MILCIGFGLPFLHSSRQLFLLLQKWQKLHFCRNTKNKSSQKKGNDPNSFLMHTLCVLWVNFNVPQFQISCSRNRKQVRGYQQKFRVNVWAGIVGDYLIGLYVLPPRLNAQSYLVFLRDVLPELLEEQLLILLLFNHWFQHDGCPSHYGVDVRRFLDQTYPNRWIGRGGPVHWPARSPDLTPLDFFFWRDMERLVYETPVLDEQDLIARIVVAADFIRNDPGVFERVRSSWLARRRKCIEVEGATSNICCDDFNDRREQWFAVL